ncbi:MAG: hypothetical protein RMK57_04250 [Bryobacterales bacterium]|nr:hypothetical protein [Bryobacteraceae bacterium]MDW8353723.1 hypothetical protein [Bryobacterales bacterium]
MKQLNINVTLEFERDLELLMKERKIARKSDAIRLAVREAVQRLSPSREYDFRSWLGQGLKAPVRRRRKFRNEDELWS